MIRVADYEKVAKERISPDNWEYISGGAEDRITLRDNIEAFKRYRVIPRMLRDVSGLDTSTTVLGHRIPFPVCLAPTAAQRFAHPSGEVASAQGAAAAGVILTLSSYASCTIESVACGAPSGRHFMQMYLFKDREIVIRLVRRAEEAGYLAIVLTIDSPVAAHGTGKRFDTERQRLGRHPHVNYVNLLLPEHQTLSAIDKYNYCESLLDAAITWDDVAWVRAVTRLPIILKGILCGEDAVKAVEVGAAGILVSNHGGRQLDTVPATLDVLREIVLAVDGGCEVYMDGGVRTGTDVFKALALGARAVFIGRPAVYALACNGADGVEEMLSILRMELSDAMTLAGCSKVSEITPSFVRQQDHLTSRI